MNFDDSSDSGYSSYNSSSDSLDAIDSLPGASSPPKRQSTEAPAEAQAADPPRPTSGMMQSGFDDDTSSSDGEDGEAPRPADNDDEDAYSSSSGSSDVRAPADPSPHRAIPGLHSSDSSSGSYGDDKFEEEDEEPVDGDDEDDNGVEDVLDLPERPSGAMGNGFDDDSDEEEEDEEQPRQDDDHDDDDDDAEDVAAPSGPPEGMSIPTLEERPMTSSNTKRFSDYENEFRAQRVATDYDELHLGGVDRAVDGHEIHNRSGSSSGSSDGVLYQDDPNAQQASPARSGDVVVEGSGGEPQLEHSLVDAASGVLAGGVPYEASLHAQTYLTEVKDEDDEDEGEAMVVLSKILHVPVPEAESPQTRAEDARVAREVLLNVCEEGNEIIGHLMNNKPMSLFPPIVPIEELHPDENLRVVGTSSFVRGGSLADYAALRTPPSLAEIRVLVRAVLKELLTLHRAGVAHGNLKASNVLISNDGGVYFTDGMGLVSSPVLSSDFSHLSPRQAEHLYQLVNEAEESVDRSAYPDESEAKARALFNLWVSYHQDSLIPEPADDHHAIGQLVYEMVTGSSLLHGKPLDVAVRAIAKKDYRPRLEKPMGHGERQRHMDVTELADVQLFITKCCPAEPGSGLASSGVDATAELLTHPFLVSGEELSDDDENHDAEALAAIGSELQRCRGSVNDGAGSLPVNAHLVRNARYALARADRRGNAVTTVTLPVLPPGCVLNASEGTLYLTGNGLQIDLHGLPQCVRTVVVRDVDAGQISVLAGFARLIVSNVTGTIVATGPCQHALIQGVKHARVATLARYLFLDTVSHLEVSYHGANVPLNPHPETCEEVTILPYSLAYPGLAADVARVHLPFESAAGLLHYPEPGASMLHNREFQDLLPTDLSSVGHDYPFLRQLCERHVFRVSGSDVAASTPGEQLALFHGEVAGKRIEITKLNGKDDVALPSVVILDSVDTVEISDCSRCTIIVGYAEGGILLRNVQYALVYCAGSRVSMQGCRGVKIHGYCPNGPVVNAGRNENIHAYPWNLDAPGLDEAFAVAAVADEDDPEGAVLPTNAFIAEVDEDNSSAGIRMNPKLTESVVMTVPGLGDPTSVVTDVSCPTRDRSDVMRPFVVPGSKPIPVTVKPVAVISDLVDVAILRAPGALVPLHQPKALLASATSHLTIRNIHTGIIHISDAIGKLRIESCTGPLEIIVTAAQSVEMVDCVNVQLDVSCFTAEMSRSHSCTVGLHCNSQPRIEHTSSDIWLRVLNVTAVDFEAQMEAVSVRPEINLFDKPIVVGPTGKAMAGFATNGTTTPPLPGEDYPYVPFDFRDVVHIGVPGEGTVLGADADADVPFCEFIEDRVQREEKRPDKLLALFAALVDLSQAEAIADESGAELIGGGGQDLDVDDLPSELPSVIRADSSAVSGAGPDVSAVLVDSQVRSPGMNNDSVDDGEIEDTPPRSRAMAMMAPADESDSSDEDEQPAESPEPAAAAKPAAPTASTVGRMFDSGFDDTSSDDDDGVLETGGSNDNSPKKEETEATAEEGDHNDEWRTADEVVGEAIPESESPPLPSPKQQNGDEESPATNEAPVAAKRYDMGFDTSSDEDEEGSPRAGGSDGLGQGASLASGAAALGIKLPNAGGTGGSRKGMVAGMDTALATGGTNDELFESQNPFTRIKKNTGNDEPSSPTANNEVVLNDDSQGTAVVGLDDEVASTPQPAESQDSSPSAAKRYGDFDSDEDEDDDEAAKDEVADNDEQECDQEEDDGVIDVEIGEDVEEEEEVPEDHEVEEEEAEAEEEEDQPSAPPAMPKLGIPSLALGSLPPRDADEDDETPEPVRSRGGGAPTHTDPMAAPPSSMAMRPDDSSSEYSDKWSSGDDESDRPIVDAPEQQPDEHSPPKMNPSAFNETDSDSGSLDQGEAASSPPAQVERSNDDEVEDDADSASSEETPVDPNAPAPGANLRFVELRRDPSDSSSDDRSRSDVDNDDLPLEQGEQEEVVEDDMNGEEEIEEDEELDNEPAKPAPVAALPGLGLGNLQARLAAAKAADDEEGEDEVAESPQRTREGGSPGSRSTGSASPARSASASASPMAASPLSNRQPPLSARVEDVVPTLQSLDLDQRATLMRQAEEIQELRNQVATATERLAGVMDKLPASVREKLQGIVC